jgi:predicted PP-loop superfamily ATPase
MKAKEILLETLQRTLDFCKELNKDASKKEELLVGYTYSVAIGASIVKKFDSLSSDEERVFMISELESALEEERSLLTKDNNFFISKNKGEA